MRWLERISTTIKLQAKCLGYLQIIFWENPANLASDMKVKIDRKYFYPDVMVDCSNEETDYFVEKPSIIVEVLSKSTRQRDKTDKRLAYFQISTLKEYVMIEQDFVEIEF